MNNINKISQYQKCTDEDISSALLKMINPLVTACGDQAEMVRLIAELAVTAWNLSLYSQPDNLYLEKIGKKLPAAFPQAQKDQLSAFTLGMIRKKQSDYWNMMRGITGYEIDLSGNGIDLQVKSLPVHPKDL